jgi:hypothetical protein
MKMDQRGLASGVIGFVAMLVVGALMFILLQPAMNEVAAISLNQAKSQTAIDVINERELIFNSILYYVLFVSVLFIIARAVFESRRP